MGMKLLEEIDALEKAGTLSGAEASILRDELGLMKAGYLQWKTGKVWHAAIVPLEKSAYDDRLLILARKKRVVKMSEINGLAKVLNKVGIKFKKSKVSLGEIGKSKDEGWYFNPTSGDQPPSGYARRIMMFAKAYKFNLLKKMAWLGEQPSVEEEQDEDLEALWQDFEKVPWPDEIDASDIDDSQVAQAEAKIDQMYSDLLMAFDEPPVIPKGSSYVEEVMMNRPDAYKAVLAELLKTTQQEMFTKVENDPN